MKHTIKITNIHAERWDTLDGYTCTIQTMLTVFGSWMWNVTDMTTGQGSGGFAKSEAEARSDVSKKLADLRGEVKSE